jgi:hypothetical protein
VIDRSTVGLDKEAVMSWFTRLFRRKPATIRFPVGIFVLVTFLLM